MKCGTHSCASTAIEYRVHWPGQTRLFCARCAARAWRIADAMGFDLAADPVNADGTDNPDGRPLLMAIAIGVEFAP